MTQGHSSRVVAIADTIGRRAGVSSADMESLRAAADFEEDVAGVVDRDLGAMLDEVGLEPDQLMRVIRAGIKDYVVNGFARWDVPDEVLTGLPNDVATFLKAEYAR